MSAADAAFQEEVRDFIAENLSDEMREAGRLNASSFADFTISQRWYQALYKRGGCPR